jgi:two-component system, OmpR family, copper resistance phosphate regulon response regulator CusR
LKLLLIEDERKTGLYLVRGLSANGFTVDLSHDGEEGFQLAAYRNYDFVILDVMLPLRDGWSVLRQLRALGKKTPVLLLSALDSVTDRVRGLSLGADDYLVKPFAFSELLARIRCILRRGSSIPDPDTIRICDVEIDMSRYKVSRSGRRVDLTPKEFQLLAVLVRRPGEVFSRAVIAEQLWDMNFDSSTNVVDVHVRRLRSKIDDPFGKKLIHTVRGLGYVFEDR